jgi:hypothetical protein
MIRDCMYIYLLLYLQTRPIIQRQRGTPKGSIFDREADDQLHDPDGVGWSSGALEVKQLLRLVIAVEARAVCVADREQVDVRDQQLYIYSAQELVYTKAATLQGSIADVVIYDTYVLLNQRAKCRRTDNSCSAVPCRSRDSKCIGG